MVACTPVGEPIASRVEEREPVTVLMPCYNSQAFLDRAVASVLEQSYRELILLAVDDSSTDDTLDLLHGWARTDSRMRVLALPRNGGPVSAMMAGYAAIDTRWVLQMDADDEMLPGCVETQMRHVRQNPEAAVVSGRAIYINSRGEELGKSAVTTLVHEGGITRARDDDVIGLLHPGSVLRRSAVLEVGGYRPMFEVAHDVDLWTRLAETGHLLLTHYDLLVRYRIHSGSITGTDEWRSALALEWVRSCARARRAGIEEPDLQRFLAEWNGRSFLARLEARCGGWRWVAYRRAGLLWGDGHRLRAMGWLAFAFLLGPGYVLRRLWAQQVR
ncbi:MAG: glycosyltransferase [Candidatus Wallbacteria bacterium]|nr:glycosyltransferase [Candidatus Wallbacteria bacterium]